MKGVLFFRKILSYLLFLNIKYKNIKELVAYKNDKSK